METNSYLQVPEKSKTLKYLAAISVFLILGTLSLPAYAASLTNSYEVVIYIMGMHLGIFLIGQWICHESKTIGTQIDLYLMDSKASEPLAIQRSIIYSAPTIIFVSAVISLLVLS